MVSYKKGGSGEKVNWRVNFTHALGMCSCVVVKVKGVRSFTLSYPIFCQLWEDCKAKFGQTMLILMVGISILFHIGLKPAWHFWLSTRFSCCLKMKSVENILGYVREQFYRFSRGCKPRENLWNCSRKYTEMFKTDSFLGNKKLSFNQNVWRDHATMQQDVLLHFWVIFVHWNQAEIWKNYSVVQL